MRKFLHLVLLVRKNKKNIVNLDSPEVKLIFKLECCTAIESIVTMTTDEIKKKTKIQFVFVIIAI